MKSLQALSRQVMAQMELRRRLIERGFLLKRLKHAVKEVKIPNGLLPVWVNGKVIRNEKGGSGCRWKRISGTGPMRNLPLQAGFIFPIKGLFLRALTRPDVLVGM